MLAHAVIDRASQDLHVTWLR